MNKVPNLKVKKPILEKGYLGRSSSSAGINCPKEKRNPSSRDAEDRHGKIVLLRCANSCFDELCISKFGDSSLLSNSAFAFRVLLWVSRLIELKG